LAPNKNKPGKELHGLEIQRDDQSADLVSPAFHEHHLPSMERSVFEPTISNKEVDHAVNEEVDSAHAQVHVVKAGQSEHFKARVKSSQQMMAGASMSVGSKKQVADKGWTQVVNSKKKTSNNTSTKKEKRQISLL
jgi:hypothetical protein